MFALLPFAILLELFATVTATPVEPAHPVITQRAELLPRDTTLGSFIGYYKSTSGSNVFVFSSEKSGSVGTVRGSTLVDWCSNDSSYLSAVCPTAYWTSCSGNTLLSEGGSSSCGSPATCDYDIVYAGTTTGSNSLRWYHCISRPWIAFYMQQPDGTFVSAFSITSDFSTFSSSRTSSSSSSTSSESTSTNSASPASSATTTAASQTASSTPTPTPPAPQKEASKAWIAGVVVGGLALIAIAAMAFYLVRQRRKNQPQQAYQPAPQGPLMQTAYLPQQGYSMQQPYGMAPAHHPVSPNVTAYDAQNFYGQLPKAADGTVMYPHYSAQPAPVPAAQTPMQPEMAATPHLQNLPELAPQTQQSQQR